MKYEVYDATPCQLGEGLLWHPLRQELFWFDILAGTLYRRHGNELQSWKFPHTVSAAGWVDDDTLLVAGQTSLLRFEISTGNSDIIHQLDPGDLRIRYNDGRADPWGGFWIGTMGFKAEKDAGTIYRYYRGELRKLYHPITVSNAMCFSPDRRFGYYTDTSRQIVWRQPLDKKHGWPVGEAEAYLNFIGTDIYPDGAICDAEGFFWNAQWGSGRLVRYSPSAKITDILDLPTDHTTCPALGGNDMRDLFATSAIEGLSDGQLRQQPLAGQTFMARTQIAGQREQYQQNCLIPETRCRTDAFVAKTTYDQDYHANQADNSKDATGNHCQQLFLAGCDKWLIHPMRSQQTDEMPQKQQ
jgi:sugar lactone lactonase YvrE